ncbi:hypothetical protein CASFOL_031320 [Castilleja foliolosa]|uniref:RNase H type-1 domain-containing protein n=1 Tax=Castilleja foliolosa TaxID=1961234 RepID=A0ABD3C527_9LAMI
MVIKVSRQAKDHWLSYAQSSIIKSKPQAVWKPPPINWVKANVDASFGNGKSHSGVVFRDSNGSIFAAASFSHSCLDPISAEGLAILDACELLSSMKIKNVIVESDCLLAISMLTTNSQNYFWTWAAFCNFEDLAVCVLAASPIHTRQSLVRFTFTKMAAPILPHQLNPRRVVDYRSMIETIRDRMVPIGVSADCFANIVALEHGYFDKMLMSLLRPFEKLEDASEIKSILLIGVSKGFFDTISGAAPATFYRFLKWLKTTDGQASLQQLNFEKSLVKRGQGKFNAREVAILTLFELQLSEFNKKVKAIRAASEAEIADLESQIREVRREGDMRIKAVHNRSLEIGGNVPNAEFDEVQMRHSFSFVDEDADFRAAKRPRMPTPVEEEAAPENPNPNDIFKTLIIDPASTKWGSWIEEEELFWSLDRSENPEPIIGNGEMRD